MKKIWAIAIVAAVFGCGPPIANEIALSTTYGDGTNILVSQQTVNGVTYKYYTANTTAKHIYYP